MRGTLSACRAAPAAVFFAVTYLFLPQSDAAVDVRTNTNVALIPAFAAHHGASADGLRAQISALKKEKRALQEVHDELFERQQVMKILKDRQQALNREVLHFQRDLEAHIRRSLSPPAEWSCQGERVQMLTPVRGGGGDVIPAPLDERWAQYILLAAKSESWAARALAHALLSQSQDRQS